MNHTRGITQPAQVELRNGNFVVVLNYTDGTNGIITYGPRWMAIEAAKGWNEFYGFAS